MPDATPNDVAVAQTAYGAGFRGQQLIQAVALALAESNGNPSALNNNPRTGDYSVGLWQVNYFGDLAQPRTQMFGSPQSLLDLSPTGAGAQRNAAAAFKLSGGGKDWTPWKNDFSNGHYYSNLPRAQSAVAQIGQTGSVGAPNSTGGGGLFGKLGTDVTGASLPGGVAAATNIPTEDHCLWKFPGLFGIGDFCLIDTNKARALGGALIMVSGGVVAVVGVLLLMGRSVNVGGAVDKVTPTGWIGAIGAAHKQNQTDRDVAFAERRAGSIDKPGQRARARQAAKPSSYGIHDVVAESTDAVPF